MIHKLGSVSNGTYLSAFGSSPRATTRGPVEINGLFVLDPGLRRDDGVIASSAPPRICA